MKWVEQGESDVVFHTSRDKANVLLIGDSIRRGYCAVVKRELADVAEVFYPEENCRSSQFIIFSLKRWAAMFDDPARVTLVQFNCGQWDAAHWSGYECSLTSETEYEKNIRYIIALLRKFFPNARIVFATTSAMNPDGGAIAAAVNPRTNEEVDRYNRIAVAVAEKEGVAVNDLNAYMREWGSECYKDLCHLTYEGFVRLGEEVARFLRSALANN